MTQDERGAAFMVARTKAPPGTKMDIWLPDCVCQECKAEYEVTRDGDCLIFVPWHERNE